MPSEFFHGGVLGTLFHTCDRAGRETLTLIGKRSFEICRDGTPVPLTDQPGIVHADVYRGDPLRSSVLHESDLAVYKPATDVVVEGEAFAPHGEPARAVHVTVRAGPIRKDITVLGDRTLEPMAGVGPMKPTRAEPFFSMPITYERAYGGYDPRTLGSKRTRFDERNPSGTGYWHGSVGVPGMRLPNVESPSVGPEIPFLHPRPEGVGAVARWWMPRRELAGTYDQRWQRERAPFLPEDFDYRHFQCASPGLIAPGHFLGDELFHITNMTPEGVLEFRLPGLCLGYTARWQRREDRGVAPLDTVYVEPSSRRVTLVWRRAFVCRRSWKELMQVTSFLVRPWAVREVLGDSALEPPGEPCWTSPSPASAR